MIREIQICQLYDPPNGWYNTDLVRLGWMFLFFSLTTDNIDTFKGVSIIV